MNRPAFASSSAAIARQIAIGATIFDYTKSTTRVQAVANRVKDYADFDFLNMPPRDPSHAACPSPKHCKVGPHAGADTPAAQELEKNLKALKETVKATRANLVEKCCVCNDTAQDACRLSNTDGHTCKIFMCEGACREKFIRDNVQALPDKLVRFQCPKCSALFDMKASTFNRLFAPDPVYNDMLAAFDFVSCSHEGCYEFMPKAAMALHDTTCIHNVYECGYSVSVKSADGSKRIKTACQFMGTLLAVQEHMLECEMAEASAAIDKLCDDQAYLEHAMSMGGISEDSMGLLKVAITSAAVDEEAKTKMLMLMEMMWDLNKANAPPEAVLQDAQGLFDTSIHD
eukprot:jgi/Mesvir1/7739/Mv11683-RA.1